MKKTIRIDAEAKDNSRAVSFDDELSHHVQEEELQALLKESAKGFWKSDRNNGVAIGVELFRLLNGSSRQLEKTLEIAYKTGDPLELCLDIPYELSSLPFELLYDKDFLLLCEHPQIYIIRKVSDRNRRKHLTPEKRPLNVLFMACSPLDLNANEVLKFEREEEQILSSVEKLPADPNIEDSGSLQGLCDMLIEGGGKYDIVHITGHAGMEYQTGPVFYMENDIGNLDKVTPDRLYQAVCDFAPRMLFLSGCSTGKSDKVNDLESFAFQMVEKGIPFVLGWGLPVSDTGAISMTTEFYRNLSMGKSVCDAVNLSRQSMKEHYHTWHLLRLFTDGSPLVPMIAPGQKLRRSTFRKTVYTYLSGSHVRVLEKGFVGRRREIQSGVQVLKGIPEPEKLPKHGILIHGPAGVGKSCLAGKLIERFSDHELIVIHGKITAPDLIIKLRKLFDRKGNSIGLEILGQDIELQDKLKALFRRAFDDMLLILYFDDFEQNLETANEPFILTSQALELFEPILTAHDWSKGNVKLMVSSRYPFMLENYGENLADKLAEISLASFQDADLEKKIAECPHISNSRHKSLYMKFGCGNPRLIEWLEKIAENEQIYDLDALAKALEGRNEDFIREYLTDMLAKAQGEAFSRFLSQAAVFRRPVKAEAYKGFGDKAMLERGVNLTLFEKEHARGHAPLYWVMPVIREKQWGKLDAGQQDSVQDMASRWYEKWLENEKNHSYTALLEGVYHALSAKRIRQACRHACWLGGLMTDMQLYYERAAMQQDVANQISDSVIAEAIREKDGDVAELLNALGRAYNMLGDYPSVIKWTEKSLYIHKEILGENDLAITSQYNNLGYAYNLLGNYEKAIEFHNRAIDIRRQKLGDKHPDVANSTNGLGEVYYSLGEYSKAIEFFQRALDIERNNFGDNHQTVAVRYNNLGSAYYSLGEYSKAIEFVERALDIYLKNFGGNHPDVAREYGNLGVAYSSLGDHSKAIEFTERALDIDLKNFGENHPNVATRYGSLGSAYNSLGEHSKAIEFTERALDIDRKNFDENHPNVATRYGSLGSAYDSLGQYEKAIEFYNRALDILKKNFGENHPDVATLNNNLGVAYEKSGEYEKAIEFHNRAIDIHLKNFGENHPSVAVCYNNLGQDYRGLGKYKKAIELYNRALDIDLKNFGENHPEVAIRYSNLGNAYRGLGKYEKAIEFHNRSIDIDRKNFGENHPQIAKYINNLGSDYQGLRQYEKAIEFHNRALDIDRKNFGENHPQIALYKDNLGLAYYSLGEHEKAIEFFQRALEIEKKIFDNHHPEIKKTMENLERAKRAMSSNRLSSHIRKFFKKIWSLLKQALSLKG
ncbi:MAG: hypothetical protein BWK80_25020 [Desulfobacteraceae bacterium IS3]|nr:MAG: hypothetical protein BWK80_25020 [Desulfobacteraceae bacterium IS3]